MTTSNTFTGNPFIDFGVSKMIADFNPAKYTEEFAKAAERFNTPVLNFDTLIDAQRRNIEALTIANQAAIDGAKAVSQRQVKILEQSFETAKKAMDKISQSATPQEAATKQADAAKQAFEKAVVSTKELTELANKSNTEAGQVIAQRISEGLGEIQELAKTFKN